MKSDAGAVPIASQEPPPMSTTWMAAIRCGHGVEVFYVPGCGWASYALGFHDGIGPYFSLPEALRRVEAAHGETAWSPSRLKQRVAVPTAEPLDLKLVLDAAQQHCNDSHVWKSVHGPAYFEANMNRAKHRGKLGEAIQRLRAAGAVAPPKERP